MKGSEKQIVWAQSIIDGLLAYNNKRLADDLARYNDEVAECGQASANGTARLELRKTVHALLTAELPKLDDAGWIIDHQGDILIKVVEQNAQALVPHKAYIQSHFRGMMDLHRWIA